MINMTTQDQDQSQDARHVLLDINGVLYNSGENFPIPGSVEAIKRLIENNIKFCLVTNECTSAKTDLVEKLKSLGFDGISQANIVSPAPAACNYLVEHKLVPRLHVWDGVLQDFKLCLDQFTAEQLDKPNCLVVGDVMSKLSRDFVDESLELMLNCEKKPTIIGLGSGRYYKDSGRLRMDTGAYVSAFEYCLGVKAVNIGKPSREFFADAITMVGGQPMDTIMIGDDVVSDVGGAQKAGLRGFLVRTGKYKPSDELGSLGVKPDRTFDDLRAAVDFLL